MSEIRNYLVANRQSWNLVNSPSWMKKLISGLRRATASTLPWSFFCTRLRHNASRTATLHNASILLGAFATPSTDSASAAAPVEGDVGL